MILKTISQRPFSVYSLQIIGIATAYFIAGELGHLLVIPPSYATVIFPSSGIALASVLLYGKRAGLGVLLGSFLLIASVPVTANDLSESLNFSLMSFTIAVGAMLQAFAGDYLVRRFAGTPNILSNQRNILLFLLYGGLVSALVNSTFSVSLLVATGKMPAEAFFANWLSWWGGDAMGIIIFAPLVLIGLSTKNPVWQGKKWAITLPIFTMFLLTALAVFNEIENSNTHIKLEFDQRAKELSLILKSSITANLNVLHVFDSLYNLSPSIDRNEFRTFSSGQLKTFKSIQAVQWVPIILEENRDAYEKNVQQEGFPRFQITERDVNNKMVRAGNRAEYAPVDFNEPYQGNEIISGFDNYSNPSRRELLDKARDTNELTTSPPIKLIQEKGTQNGFLVYMPLYRPNQPHGTLEERRNAIASYIAVVVRTGDMMADAFKNQNLTNVAYRLVDISAAAGEQMLCVNNEQEFKTATLQPYSRTLHSFNKFEVGGRVWQFEMIPTTDYFNKHRSINVWLILLAGFSSTTIVIITALVSAIRQYKVQQLVDKQFAINQELSKFKMGLDCLATGIIFVDNDRNITYINNSTITLHLNNEDAIRKDLPFFNSVDLIGKNIDLFHKNPEHQAKLLAELKGTAEVNIKIANLILNVKASPLMNEFGQRIGSVAEVINITEKENRAAELVITNEKLAVQTAEKQAATTKLAILNAINAEKEKRTNELISVNKHLTQANEEIAMNLQILAVVNDEKERVAIELANFHIKNNLLIHQMNQVQRLESIGRVTSGIAHEFNNILGCIIGYNDMNQYVSEDMTDENLKIELENNTKQVSFAVKRAAELINKMLVYCRQDTPQKKINVQPTQAVIEEFLVILRQTLNSQITIETLFEDDNIIHIDARNLQQILTDLISNARDAMNGRDGIITILLKQVKDVAAHCVACASAMEGDFIELSVIDNGTGIDPKIITRLFDPFFTTKEQGDGTGLGLSTVSGIVHQSGGHLLVESNQSEFNQGSSFTLLFPSCRRR